MLQTTPKPKDAFALCNELEAEADKLGCIYNLLFHCISEHDVGRPLPNQEHNNASWLISQIWEVKEKMLKQAEELLELHKEQS